MCICNQACYGDTHCPILRSIDNISLHTCTPSLSCRKATKRSLEVYTPPAKRSNTSVPGQPSSEETTPPEPWHQHRTSKHHKTYHTDKTPYPGKKTLSNKDYHLDRDPSRWTEYDLKDVGTGDVPAGMSDEQMNRHTAYQFLSAIKKQTWSQQDDKQATNSKIVFRKPVASLRKMSPPSADTRDRVSHESLSQASPMRTLPEHVVGGKTSCSQRSLKKLTPLSSVEDTACTGMEGGNETGDLHSGEGGRKGQEKVVAHCRKSAIILSHLDED